MVEKEIESINYMKDHNKYYNNNQNSLNESNIYNMSMIKNTMNELDNNDITRIMERPEDSILDLTIPDKLELGGIVSNLVFEKIMIPTTSLTTIEGIFTELLPYISRSLLTQQIINVDINIKLEMFNPTYKEVILIVLKQLCDYRPSHLEVIDSCFELQEKLFLLSLSIKVDCKINSLFKSIYTCCVDFQINRKYNNIKLLFKSIDYKYYARTKFIRKHVVNSNCFIQDVDSNTYDNNNMTKVSAKKNILVQHGNLNEVLKVDENNHLDWLEVDESHKIIEDLKTEFNKLVYMEAQPHIVEQTQKIKKSKGFVFLQSYKSPEQYKCHTCKNTKELPIQRIYYEEKNHKLCKLNMCQDCFAHYTSNKENWYLCFICKKFLVNFGKLSKVKGGKPKKVWEETEINLLEA